MGRRGRGVFAHCPRALADWKVGGTADRNVGATTFASGDALLAIRLTMTLADFTSPALIVPCLRGHDAASVIQELSRVLQRENRVKDLLPFYHTALNREFLVRTDLEAGTAFPHARVPGLKELSFALGRSPEPMRWGGDAARSVGLVFLIAIPATDATQYLLLSAGLARLSKNNRLVTKLHDATDALQMLEVLEQVRMRETPPSDDLGKRLAR